MQIHRRVSRAFAAALFAAVLATALVAAGAFGAEQTRESYVAQVEPICKKSTQSLEKALQGVKLKIKLNKLKPAAAQFAAAALAFEKGVKQLKAVAQPEADTAKLGKWLKQLEAGTELLKKIGKALKADQKGLAQNYIVKLSNNSRVANNLVLGFEFHYCLVDSSKFS
jgi:murein L,D-transpeptidase YcbB/YkuD